MNLRNRFSILFFIAISCVGCDQGTKSYASQVLPRGHMDSYLFDFFRIGYTENVGAFLGMGSNLSPELRFWFFSVVAGFMLFGVLAYLLFSKHQGLYSVVGLSLIFSGGISNLYDRIVNDGAVVDFLNVGVFSLRTGIFNIADMAILLGAIMFALLSNYGQHQSE